MPTLRSPSVNNIRTIRRAKDITQAQLGERLGIKQPTVAGMERAVSMRRSTAKRIAEALGVTVRKLGVTVK